MRTVTQFSRLALLLCFPFDNVNLELESKIGFPENEASMARRWLHDLEPVNHLENLGHIHHCACFPRTLSQRIYVKKEILRIRGDCRPRRPKRLCRWD